MKANKMEQLIKQNENVKRHKFFTVSASAPNFVPQPAGIREEKWENLCKAVNLPLESSWIEKTDFSKQQSVVLKFSNGLMVKDEGSQVSFWAATEKSDVDILSALDVVRCSANHLCRRGFGTQKVGSETKAPISEILSGSTQMIDAFEAAYKEARSVINNEQITQMIQQRNI